MAVTREDLDKMACAAPGCAHDGHGPLYVHANCHPSEPPWASYIDGELTVVCSVCRAPVIVIAVAAEALSGKVLNARTQDLRALARPQVPQGGQHSRLRGAAGPRPSRGGGRDPPGGAPEEEAA